MGQRPSFSHLTGYPEAVASAPKISHHMVTRSSRICAFVVFLRLWSICALWVSRREIFENQQEVMGYFL